MISANCSTDRKLSQHRRHRFVRAPLLFMKIYIIIIYYIYGCIWLVLIWKWLNWHTQLYLPYCWLLCTIHSIKIYVIGDCYVKNILSHWDDKTCHIHIFNVSNFLSSYEYFFFLCDEKYYDFVIIITNPEIVTKFKCSH